MSSLVGVTVRSDTGAVRHVNEDSALAQDPVFVVADGMGGHARGDLASRTAVESLARTLQPGSRPTPDEVIRAIDEANAAVRSLSGADESGAAVAGTTLAGIVRVRVPELAAEQWMVVNVGDSRVYAWDGRQLRQLTVDHSAVQELVDAGLISEAQAAVHPERNVITRALGAEDFVDTDSELVAESGRQIFLICSDGLTRELSDQRIAEILAQGPSDPASALVDAANEAGGHDNITVIVVESVTGEDTTAPVDTRERADGSGREFEDTQPRE
ncbi:protein phosphatase 2C domain-containing protein [Leifsonia sp. 1010]|uniref:PP2C family protein-serine/threonine phosphatase n=1 Tax=Leifsonia sp. 1010 TaxID=2817769 RepID=UPI002855801E|nr:protein phosphatase 2C domain-containing protein [Leifsonia sp. 1010]MDR6612932.1 serine/threonine protein phosphatase PrpC [Leifsonia sp. 1010]